MTEDVDVRYYDDPRIKAGFRSLTPTESSRMKLASRIRADSRGAVTWKPSLTQDNVDRLFQDINTGLCDYYEIQQIDGMMTVNRIGSNFLFTKGTNTFECATDEIRGLASPSSSSWPLLARPWLTGTDIDELKEWLSGPGPYEGEMIIDRTGSSFSVDLDDDDRVFVFTCPGREDFSVAASHLNSLRLPPESLRPQPVPEPEEPKIGQYVDSKPWKKLIRLQDELRAVFLGENMGEATLSLLVGLLAEENVFLGGPPGTGKTSLVKALGNAVEVPFRKRLAGMETTSRDLFGPIDAKKYAEGVAYERMTVNTFSDAKMSFLDEGFKASKQALQLLLDYYEDGEIDNGSGQLKTPHRFGVIASNELAPKGSDALLDRFPIRCWGDKPLNQKEEMVLMRRSVELEPVPPITVELTADDLAELRKMASDIPVSNEAFAATQAAIEMMRNGGMYFSVRQITGVMPILRAFALLTGADSVGLAHVNFLQFLGWTTQDQRKVVGKAATTAAKTAQTIGEWGF